MPSESSQFPACWAAGNLFVRLLANPAEPHSCLHGGPTCIPSGAQAAPQHHAGDTAVFRFSHAELRCAITWIAKPATSCKLRCLSPGSKCNFTPGCAERACKSVPILGTAARPKHCVTFRRLRELGLVLVPKTGTRKLRTFMTKQMSIPFARKFARCFCARYVHSFLMHGSVTKSTGLEIPVACAKQDNQCTVALRFTRFRRACD